MFTFGKIKAFRATIFPSFHKKPELLLLVANQNIYFPTHPEYSPLPATPEALTTFLASHAYRRILVLLEFPWIHTQFTKMIPLASHDLDVYLKNQFELIYTPQCSLGIAMTETNHPQQIGLFSAALPESIQSLLQAFSQSTTVSIEYMPAIYFYSLHLQSHYESFTGILQSISESWFLEIKQRKIEKLILLPAWSLEGMQMFLQDHHQIQQQMLQINDLSFLSQHFPHFLQSSQAKQTSKKKPKSIVRADFNWELSTAKLSLSIPKLSAFLLLSMTLILMLFHYSTQQNIHSLQQQIFAFEEKIETGKQEIQKMKEFTTQQNQFVRLQTMYQHLQESSVVAENVLQQIITPTSKIWIKQLIYEKQQLELTLLSLEATEIPRIIHYFSSLPSVQNVQLKSQKTIQIQQKSALETILMIHQKPHE